MAASALAAGAAAADAGELLVIPYTCRASEGRPVLTPSGDQGYRVIGPREERDFTACSPANPDMCRRWRVYRFDVDCGGQRVPWAEVSAAADAQAGGRSWVEDGSLHLEMPPRWGLSTDDPCARPARAGFRDGPLRSRLCAERRAAARSDVAMPAGFAPMLELDGIFVADATPTAPGAGAGAAPSARAALPVPKPKRAEAPDTAVKPANAGAPAKPAAMAKAPAAAPAGKSVPAVSAPEPAKREVAGAPAAASPPAASTAAGAGAQAAPTIINGTGAPRPAKDAAAAAPASMPETTSALQASESAPIVVAMKDAGGNAGGEDRAPSLAFGLLAALTKSVSPTILVVGGGTMLALLAMAFALRRTEADAGFPLARDIGDVSFDGPQGGRDLVRGGRWLNARARAEANRRSPAWASNAIPQSREEAMQVLGMGVAPGVSETAIKKIVDGLRLSWHPDYAKDAEDRAVRELRMKQINAAWDIITGKRAG